MLLPPCGLFFRERRVVYVFSSPMDYIAHNSEMEWKNVSLFLLLTHLIHTRKIFFVFLFFKKKDSRVFFINAQQQTIFRLRERDESFFLLLFGCHLFFQRLGEFCWPFFPPPSIHQNGCHSNNNGEERAWHALCFFFLLNPFFLHIHGHKVELTRNVFILLKNFFVCLFVVFTIFRDVDISPLVLL